MFPLERALNSINNSLNHPTGWEVASVIISGLGLIATVIVIIYNHKSIMISQKSIRQAVSLQLYEKRLVLFNHLSDQDAFKNAPLELKIVFSDQVYAKYKEIAELCQVRWKKTEEYLDSCMVFGSKHMPHVDSLYNLCEETMSTIDDNMEQTIQSIKDSNHSRTESLIRKQKDIQKLTKEIREKLPVLEQEMGKIVKESIGIEE